MAGRKHIPYVGKRIKNFVVLKHIGKDTKGYYLYKCICDCGKDFVVSSEDIKQKFNCGCRGNKLVQDFTKRVCPRCKKEQSLNNFYKSKRSRLGVSSYCKRCSAYIGKEYRKKNKNLLAKNRRDRHNTDINFRLTNNLRARIYAAIKLNVKSCRTKELLGCSIEKLKIRLENQFDDNMNWSNYGKYWHIDHIRPCASFDLSDDKEQKRCFHHTNLQPLEVIENIRKGSKYG